MSNTISPAEELMRARLQQQLIDEDKERGHSWEHVGGTAARWSNGLYFAFTIYAFLVYFFNEIIIWAAGRADLGEDSAQRLRFIANNGWLVHGLILLTLVAVILQIARKYKIAYCVQSVTTVIGIIQVLQVFGGYTNDTLLGVMYMITFLGFLSLSFADLIRLLDWRRLEQAVEKEYQKIYKRYADKEDTMLTGNQLESIVLAYEKALQKGEDPPKTID